MTTKPRTITTDATAEQYLVATGRATDIDLFDKVAEDGTRFREVQHCCGRCGGTGIYSHYHGTCYACGGHRPRWTSHESLVSFARRARKQDNAKARAEEKAAEAEDRSHKFAADAGIADAIELEHPLIDSIRVQLRARGEISPKQVEAVRKVAASLAARENEQHAAAPEGRTEIEGTIVSIKDSDFGLRMVVKVEGAAGSWLCMGTLPRSIYDGAERGSGVRFTATLKPGREPHFAFFSRPAKATLVAPNA